MSQSMDQSNIAMGKDPRLSGRDDKAESRGMQRDSEQSKSHGVLNKPFDEALEFSQSGSDDSVDTRLSEKKNKPAMKNLDDNISDSKQGPSSSYQKPGGAPINQLQSNAGKQAVEKLVSPVECNADEYILCLELASLYDSCLHVYLKAELDMYVLLCHLITVDRF